VFELVTVVFIIAHFSAASCIMIKLWFIGHLVLG